MKNKVQLTTYIDRLSGGGIQDLQHLLEGPLKDVFGAAHLLPFFDPIDGSDAGFDPADHMSVDARLGKWQDVKALSGTVDLMADLIVNHVSSQSPQFLDYSQNGSASPYDGLFLTMGAVFPKGATEAALLKIYRPRPGLPFTYASLENGEKRILWTTFTPQQIDIDVTHPEGKRYLRAILDTFAANGIRMIRMDAAGYAIKVAGTSCFMIPETFAFIEEITEYAHSLGIEVLVEIHSYFSQQIEIAKKVDRVYDFALPPLILHALYVQTARHLKQWLTISPRNCITVLDTHDGIGVIDVGPDPAAPLERRGLLAPQDIDLLVEEIHRRSQGQSRQATGAAASNLDLYQVNCTYYDALGRDDKLYLLARMIQFFSPGVPQVYYVGLLAGENDMELLEESKVGRDINRHYYKGKEVENAIQKPVVQKLLGLIRLRNSLNAFNGHFSVKETSDEQLGLQWEHNGDWACLWVNFEALEYEITYSQGGVEGAMMGMGE